MGAFSNTFNITRSSLLIIKYNYFERRREVTFRFSFLGMVFYSKIMHVTGVHP